MLEFVLGFLFGYFFISLMVRWYHRKQQREFQQEISEFKEKIEELRDKIIPLHIRMESNILYAFHAETSQFIAQGSDLDMLRINFTSLYPEKKGVVVSSDENCEQIIKEYSQKQGKSVVTKGES